MGNVGGRNSLSYPYSLFADGLLGRYDRAGTDRLELGRLLGELILQAALAPLHRKRPFLILN